MRAGLSPAVATCLLGLMPSGALTATVSSTVILTMDDDPQATGWRLWEGGGGHVVRDGVLHIEAPSYYEFFAPPEVWVDRVSNAKGWTVEARLRRDPGSVGAPGMWIDDDRYLTLFGLREDGLHLGDGSDFTGQYSIDTSMFHTYRFEGRQNNLNVFVDDILALSLEPVGPIGATFALAFGDNNAFASGTSISEWDYVSVTTTAVPLPLGIWLLGSGLLAAVSLKWRPYRTS